MYDDYIFYDASIENPPLFLRVSMCIDLNDRCPEMFIYSDFLILRWCQLR